MQTPEELKFKIEQIAQSYKLSDLISCSKKITEKYLNKSGNNEHLLSTRIDVVTYAIARMPATCAALSFSLEKMLENIEDNHINSILDIGSGTGTSYFALSSKLENKFSLTCVEREPEMISLAKELIDADVNFINCDSTKEFPNGKYDLVLASYFINELDDEATFKVLDRMLEASNKYVLIVDPGTPESFSRIRKIRNYCVEKGLNIIAPCSHSKVCPICGEDWCHFVTRINRSKLHKALKEGDSPYEDEKFSYIAISKLPIKNNERSRILRRPIIQSGFVRAKLCNPNGDIKEETITKSNKERYKAIKKADVGDLL